jgi:hypothetical protein
LNRVEYFREKKVEEVVYTFGIMDKLPRVGDRNPNAYTEMSGIGNNHYKEKTF